MSCWFESHSSYQRLRTFRKGTSHTVTGVSLESGMNQYLVGHACVKRAPDVQSAAHYSHA